MSNTEQQIASDLDTIDLILAIGTKSQKRKAMAHRKACFAEIKRMNEVEGIKPMTDDELLAALIE